MLEAGAFVGEHGRLASSLFPESRSISMYQPPRNVRRPTLNGPFFSKTGGNTNYLKNHNYFRQISPGQSLLKSTGLNVSLSIQTGRSSLV